MEHQLLVLPGRGLVAQETRRQSTMTQPFYMTQLCLVCCTTGNVNFQGRLTSSSVDDSVGCSAAFGQILENADLPNKILVQVTSMMFVTNKISRKRNSDAFR